MAYHPAGSATPLLNGINLQMPNRGLGVIVGSSGAGKTTLLSCIAGLLPVSGGAIHLGESVDPDESPPTGMEKLNAQVGMVFQFPERHFLADNILQELTFGWPSSGEKAELRRQLGYKLQGALTSVGMGNIDLETPVDALSGGYQRRLALALQLVRMPSLLLLDEPLAGLDWRTRAELVPLLAKIKTERAVLIVSHDLQELAPLVDHAWRMAPGGKLESIPVEQLTHTCL
eukprot:CAMPEP_0196583442 /NCGR_PEP_ID=MMETSP1081-20130531/43624_1 /TAXON_ID=36882 /ORGANISM="Pyramimonas amylifera, Strain CCMP720" /LENGTH=229 /DNA_ID=CAMNT_0041904339 /DNA_START=418 /DNA_END=1107 /DNA_ORIENTATION=-